MKRKKPEQPIPTSLNWTKETFLPEECTPEDLHLESVCDYALPQGPFVDGYTVQGKAFVLWCRDGEARLTFDDHDPITLRKDEFTIFFTGHTIAIEAIHQQNLLTRFIIAGTKVETFFNRMGFFDCFKGMDPLPIASVSVIRNAQERKLSTGRTIAKEQNAVVIRLIDNFFTSIYKRARQHNPIFYSAANKIIRGMTKKKVRIANIAKSLGVTEVTIFNAFRRQGYANPTAFISRMLVHRARRLLLETTTSVAGIAKACGFTSSANFTAFFKHQTGMLPTAVRGKHRMQGECERTQNDQA